MIKCIQALTFIICAICLYTGTASEKSQKPLKVFILAGQSNMQGHAMVSTLERMKLDPKQAQILSELQDSNGNALVLDDVRISALGLYKDEAKVVEGKLTTGFGADFRTQKIGPEYSFGIYLHKTLQEPILIIKTAWGGKSLFQDFRSPSSGIYNPYTKEDLAKRKAEGQDIEKLKADALKANGKYYRLMIQHIKEVLSDAKKIHPQYNPKQGYTLSGFVWFQGWNDMGNRYVYPNRNKPNGYDMYAKNLCHFIRDVRKDLAAPKMPFVIGVMGTEGLVTKESEAKRQRRYRGIQPAFRSAMAYPTTLDEFKGNVVAVKTGKYWDVELSQLLERQHPIHRQLKDAQKQGHKNINKLKEELMAKEFSAKERKILATGKSNAGYHYNGSGLTMIGIGKGFAEAVLRFRQ